jgi:hypothetical protein
VSSFGPANQRRRTHRTPPLRIRVDPPPFGDGRVDRGTIRAEMQCAFRAAENMAALVTMDAYAGVGL